MLSAVSFFVCFLFFSTFYNSEFVWLEFGWNQIVSLLLSNVSQTVGWKGCLELRAGFGAPLLQEGLIHHEWGLQ